MEVLRARDAETWHHACNDTFVPMETVTGDVFVGQIEHLTLDRVSVSRVTCDPCQVGRSRRVITSAPSPDVLVNLVDRGVVDVRTVEGRRSLGETQAALCEADAEYHLEIPARATVLTLQLDRSLLPIPDSRVHDAHAVPMQSAGRVAVLHHFMAGLLAGSSVGLDGDAQLGTITRDLLLLALHEHDDLATSVEEDSAYVLLRTVLERNFTDPELTIDGVADNLRVSRRYIETVFARHDLSPGAFLRALRVDRARLMLGTYDTLTVAEVARCSGFNDVGTFSRAFRRATGLPPDTWRRGCASTPDHHGTS